MVFGFRSRDEVNREVKRVCPSVSPLFCDIKMFCAPFACVQGSQNRLHLSQRDTTEKSECKTLIRPDPDEGFITESAGDSALPRSSLVHRFGAKHAAFYTRASGRGAALEDRVLWGLLCMQVCTVQVACLLMHECTYANEEEEAWLPSGRRGWRSQEREPPSAA